MGADPHVANLSRKVAERLAREDVAEVINRSTVDDGHGHWITTVIWRTPDRSAPIGLDGALVSYRETRWMVLVDGTMQAGGGAEPEWGEEA